jgi:hypothetical protein
MAVLVSISREKRLTEMKRQTELGFLEFEVELDIGVASPEFRIYRPNGALAVIYFTAFRCDEEATFEAEKIARCGYHVDIWVGGTRTNRVFGPSSPSVAEYRGHAREC